MDDTVSDVGRGRSAPARLVSLWFGMQRDVTRLTYVASLLALLGLRYVIERGVIQATTGRLLSPLQALAPTWAGREELLAGAPDAAFLALVAVWLVSLWVGLSLSVRRASNAGVSPWLGMLVLVPLVNCVVVPALALLPVRPRRPRDAAAHGALGAHDAHGAAGARACAFGLVVGLLGGLVVMAVSVFALRTYALSLFVGMPIVAGGMAACAASRGGRLGVGAALGLGGASALLGGGVMLLTGLEGALCLSMALPLALPLGMLGGAIGRHCASIAPGYGALAAMAVLPVYSGLEAWGNGALAGAEPLHQVISAVEIDAPPERVWPLVLDAGELPAPDGWCFRHGVAFPTGARVKGSGVGAECQFDVSTGTFAGPVTTWEPPYHLAFDVTSQPPPMTEWSPWGAIAPPHLDDALLVRRGEVKLLPLAGGRTRLEARTTYELRMAPRPYWLLWSDAIMHRVHDGVLQPIKVQAETRR